MRGSERRTTRHRIYSLVALLLAVILMIVGMSGLLQVGQRKLAATVYKEPYRTLIALGKAENRFRMKDLDEDGRRDFAASLQELGDAGCITKKLARGDVGDYRYEILQADLRTWSMRASPTDVTSQSLFYFMDQTQIIRAKRGSPADGSSEVYYHPFRGRVWSGSEAAITK